MCHAHMHAAIRFIYWFIYWFIYFFIIIIIFFFWPCMLLNFFYFNYFSISCMCACILLIILYACLFHCGPRSLYMQTIACFSSSFFFLHAREYACFPSLLFLTIKVFFLCKIRSLFQQKISLGCCLSWGKLERSWNGFSEFYIVDLYLNEILLLRKEPHYLVLDLGIQKQKYRNHSHHW